MCSPGREPWDDENPTCSSSLSSSLRCRWRRRGYTDTTAPLGLKPYPELTLYQDEELLEWL